MRMMLCGVLAGWISAGCAANLRPLVPMRVQPATGTSPSVPPGGTARLYDFTGDGRPDYRQTLWPDGQVRLLEFDDDGDGVFDRSADLSRLDPRTARHLFLLLDGVPFWIIEQMWRDGHFRLFSRPGRLISTFPSLTDPVYCQFFHVPGPFGYEAEYFDRAKGRRTSGKSTYLSGSNEPWVEAVDHRISLIEDAVMYLFPGTVFKRELAAGRRVYGRMREQDRVVLYFLSTDGICHMYTPQRAREHLALLDAWIERIVHDAGGRLHVTMFADHGNNFTPGKYVAIDKALRLAGLRVGKVLRRPGDVVAPQFGLISFGSVFCCGPAERQRAVEAIARLEGVDAITWRAGDEVEVCNRNGRATISRRLIDDRLFYRYAPAQGDPLVLASVIADFARQGVLTPDGYAPDEAWFEATAGLPIPDPIHRLYTSLTTIVLNPADILVSLADGYYYGDRDLDAWVTLGGTHGGLSAGSSVSFLMSTAFAAPPVARYDGLLAEINRHVPWTPHVPWVDYSWLERYRPRRESPAAETLTR